MDKTAIFLKKFLYLDINENEQFNVLESQLFAFQTKQTSDNGLSRNDEGSNQKLHLVNALLVSKMCWNPIHCTPPTTRMVFVLFSKGRNLMDKDEL